MQTLPAAAETLAAAPFLRWAGGKRQLLKTLLEHAPADVAKRTYVEPFLGAGTLFFSIKPKRAILGDANAFLIDAYQQIRDRPAIVLKSLSDLISAHSYDNYYDVRDAYNEQPKSPEQAARFIYLNKAGFNGVFRVNMKGVFNVPKGNKDKLAVPSEEQFQAIAESLKSAKIAANDYKKTLAGIRRGSFVYFDPPYPALNETAYFAHYTKDRFDSKDQAALAEVVHKLHKRGVLFLMSNANVPEIQKLYASYTRIPIPVRRFVSCKGKRLQVSELLIKNY